jgi:hypothetical protein
MMLIGPRMAEPLALQTLGSMGPIKSRCSFEKRSRILFSLRITLANVGAETSSLSDAEHTKPRHGIHLNLEGYRLAYLRRLSGLYRP